MKIAIYDLDKTSYPNMALMKIASYYGNVEWYLGSLFSYDKIYCSSVFKFSDKSTVSDEMICGGGGFDLATKLPEEIEKCEPDYSIYPSCNFSLIYFSRGCNRNCEFCIVGKYKKEELLTINPKSEYLKIMDDNFFLGKWKDKIAWIKECGYPVEIMNVDARLLNKEKAEALNSLKRYGNIHMAWDNPKDNIDWEQIAEWIKPYKITVYVLIGYWSTEEEDLYRVMKLRELGFNPFVMPYDKKDYYQKRFARWVNIKAIFKSVEWKNYK